MKYKERCNGPSLKTQESQLKGRFFFFYRVTEKHERNSYAQTQPQDSSAVFNFLPSSTPLLSALPCLGADGPVLLELQAQVAEPLPRVLPGRLPPVSAGLHHRRELVVAYFPVLRTATDNACSLG